MSDIAINRDAWREQIVEAPIDPDMPIIDPHHHIWPQAPMADAETWDADDLLAYKSGSGHNIVATMFVESGIRYRTSGQPELASVGETEFAEEVAQDAYRRGGKATGAVAGIVAGVDLTLGARVAQVLDAHLDASPRLRGIRSSIAHDADMPYELGTRPGTMAEPAFRDGVAALASRNLVLDVWLMQPQMAELVDLARAFPDTSFVLDHVGTPMGVGRFARDREGSFADWRTLMAALAEMPNVSVKLGGLNMPLTGLCVPADAPRPWTSEEMAQAQARHILTAIDIFGPKRCMFESNFPVDRALTNGTVLWNAFKRMVAAFSADEKHALFYETADRIYRLGLGGDAA